MKSNIIILLIMTFIINIGTNAQIKTNVIEKGYLLDNCQREAQVLKKIKAGSVIIFIKADDKNPVFYYIDYKGTKGYIHKSLIYQTQEIKEFILHYNDSIANAQKEQKQLQDIAYRRDKIRSDSIRMQSLIKEYGNKYSSFIFYNKVVIGMTDEMVIESWGHPERKNISKYSFGTHEQWVYDLGRYVYFENKVVTAIQTQE